MDEAKRVSLIEKLSALPEGELVTLDEFFDGNDDLGSIGCNLMQHPGIDMFRDTLCAIASRDDVTGVFVQICEVNPGFGSWPFSDVVFVKGSIKETELEGIVAVLEADEVCLVNDRLPAALQGHGPAFRIWWD